MDKFFKFIVTIFIAWFCLGVLVWVSVIALAACNYPNPESMSKSFAADFIEGDVFLSELELNKKYDVIGGISRAGDILVVVKLQPDKFNEFKIKMSNLCDINSSIKRKPDSNCYPLDIRSYEGADAEVFIKDKVDFFLQKTGYCTLVKEPFVPDWWPHPDKSSLDYFSVNVFHGHEYFLINDSGLIYLKITDHTR